MSIYVAPETACWNSLAENIVHPAICMVSCSLANSWGMPVTTWGKLSPCRNLSISVNPGGGVCHQLLVFSCCDSTFWVGMGDGLTTWLVAVGFKYPMPQATANVPLAQALRLLLQLHSREVGRSMGSDVWEDVILTQLDGRVSSRTSALVNMVSGSMACQSSSTFSASWQGSAGSGGWASSTQYGRALA